MESFKNVKNLSSFSRSSKNDLAHLYARLAQLETRKMVSVQILSTEKSTGIDGNAFSMETKKEGCNVGKGKYTTYSNRCNSKDLVQSFRFLAITATHN